MTTFDIARDAKIEIGFAPGTHYKQPFSRRAELDLTAATEEEYQTIKSLALTLLSKAELTDAPQDAFAPRARLTVGESNFFLSGNAADEAVDICIFLDGVHERKRKEASVPKARSGDSLFKKPIKFPGLD